MDDGATELLAAISLYMEPGMDVTRVMVSSSGMALP